MATSSHKLQLQVIISLAILLLVTGLVTVLRQRKLFKGVGSTVAKTIVQLFRDTVSKHGGRPAMGLKRKPPVSRPTLSSLCIFYFGIANKV
jgi:hypothetical protein